MTISLTVTEFCFVLLTIGVLFLICFLIKVLRNLNRTLTNTYEITEVTKNKVKEVDQALNKLKEVDRIFKVVKNKLDKKNKKEE